MASTLDGWPYVTTDRGIRVTACAPHDLLARLGDKWTVLVVSLLSIAPHARLRFSELKYGVEGISQRMLTLTLRQLERDGLVHRHYHPEVPPRVEYELTELGRDLHELIRVVSAWVREHSPRIDQARESYDRCTAQPPRET